MDSVELLRSFHRRHAGASQRVFGGGRAADGRASYERLADLAAGRVLDLACGDGPLASLLVARGHEVIGLDMSPEELAIARKRVRGARFVEARAEQMPFESASFDAVLSHMAFMLMLDAERVVAEIARVLAPGGVVAVVVGRKGEPTQAATELLSWLAEARAREGGATRWGDPRTREVDGLRELFADGFVDHAHEDFAIELGVPAAEIEEFFGLLFYEADLLSDEHKRELRAYIHARRDALAPGGTMAWSIGMRLFRARRSRSP